jgi:hypothetical protein
MKGHPSYNVFFVIAEGVVLKEGGYCAWSKASTFIKPYLFTIFISLYTNRISGVMVSMLTSSA